MALCLFCSNRADSKEDIFSTWLTREFPEIEGSYMPVTMSVGGLPQKTWDNWSLAFSKIRAVCESCNRGWMGSWETPAKLLLAKMIRGQKLRLTEIDQLTLATWATIKAYVFDSGTQFPSAVSRAECELLKSQQRPPGNVRVFLAAHDVREYMSFMVRRVYAYGPKEGAPGGQGVHATTFVLGHAVIQVFGNSRSAYRPFESVGVTTDESQTILPPVIGGSTWPPRSLLDDDALDQFGRQFLRATEIIEVDDPNDPRLKRPF